MKVISFYTADNDGSYAEEVKFLIASLERFGVPHHIEEKRAWGDWYDHTAHKADFIREMRAKFEGPLLWIDADAIVHSDPTSYFEELADFAVDFGVHYFRGPGKGYDQSQVQRDGWRLLSGTTWWGDTPRARTLLDAWVGLNETLRAQGIREGGGQKNLWYLTTCFKGLKIHRLPGSYCYVFDKQWAYPHPFKATTGGKRKAPVCSVCGHEAGHFLHAGDEPCVIEQTIASRDHRAKRQQTSGRKARIIELRGEETEVILPPLPLPSLKQEITIVEGDRAADLRDMVYETSKVGPLTVAWDYDDTWTLNPDLMAPVSYTHLTLPTTPYV